MPRTLAQNAQYIANTIKPAIKSAIEAQGVTVPSTDSFLDYADRIAEIEGGGSGYQLKDLPTGAISTVTDAAPLPLNALKVSVEAWQEGSGDPSPSNIRPIHGWDSGEITVCDDIQSPTQTETTSLDFPTTIYGAEWDVTDGPLDNQWDRIKIKDCNWDKQSGRYANFVTTSLQNLIKTSDTEKCAKTELYASESNQSSQVDKYQIYANSAGHVKIGDWAYNNVTDFVNARGEEYIYYLLATPTTIDLSPLSIRLNEGTNNLYADCGEVIKGEYFVDEGAIDVRKVDYSIGSNSALKISDGRILQGFANMTNYHARPLDVSGNWLDVDWSKDFEIGVAFKFTAFPAYQGITGDGNYNSWRKAPRMDYDNNEGKINLCISSDGSTLAIDAYLDYSLAINKWYFVKLKFVKSTMALTVDITEDFDTYTSGYSGTLASTPYHDATSLCFGGDAQQSNMASNTFLIDTFNTYIKGDGVDWGAFTGVFPS